MMKWKGENMRYEFEHVLPADIESRSFAIIEEELTRMGRHLKEDEAPIIMRAIHTTADFDYADNLVFSPDAVRLGREALRAGARIVTDTRMALAGINKKRLEALGGEALCFMGDADVALAAKERGSTRAAASMEKAARLYGKQVGDGKPIIFAIGNAPTALVSLYELIGKGALAPALIIAAPVGFVNVVPAKEQILSLENVPYIVARGRKGGSGVAAAICNALLYTI